MGSDLRTGAVILFALAAGCGGGPRASSAVAPRPVETMPTPVHPTPLAIEGHPFARHVATIPDEAYFASMGPHRGPAEDPRIASLPMDAVGAGFRGLLLGAPRRVDLDVQGHLWAFVIVAGTERHDAPFLRNSTLVATDLEDGGVFAGRGLSPDPTKHGDRDVEDEPLPPPPPPTPPDRAALGEGQSAGLVWIDYLDTSLPPRSTRWVLRLLSFDERSNDVFVETSARSAGPTAGERAHPLLAASRSDGPPRLEVPGAALSFGGRASPSSLVLHGSLRLEPARYMFASRPPHVKAKVLLLAKNHSAPVQVPITIALPPTTRSGDLVDVAFSIDVGDTLPQKATGAWQAYLVAGRHLSPGVPLQP